ncbi:MAG: hypothetical protein RL557_245 [archaeon]
MQAFEGVSHAHVRIAHIPDIREPLLLADLIIAQPQYGQNLIKKDTIEKRVFGEVEREIMTDNGLFNPEKKTDFPFRFKLTSDFVIAYTLLRNDTSSCGEEYAKAAHPAFLERVLKGIVALRFARLDETKEERRMNRLYELLPQIVHQRLKPLREEADWTSPAQWDSPKQR